MASSSSRAVALLTSSAPSRGPRAAGWDVTILSGSHPRSRSQATPAPSTTALSPAVDFTPARSATRSAARVRRCTRASRTATTPPTASWPRSTTRSSSARSSWSGARAARRRRERRRPAPAPPDPDQRGGRARRAGRAGRRPPPRHRAADARGDRRRSAAGWEHAEAWAERMRAGRRPATALSCCETPDRAPTTLLGVDPDRCVLVPTASTRSASRPRGRPRRVLAPAPRRGPAGLASRRTPGSVAYADEEVAGLDDAATVLIAVGRFTAVKRLGAAHRGVRRARRAARPPAALVIVGGHPASGRASTRRGDRAPRRAATSSSRAGMGTTSSPASSTRPTSRCSPPSASSSGWSSSRGWRAGCP